LFGFSESPRALYGLSSSFGVEPRWDNPHLVRGAADDSADGGFRRARDALLGAPRFKKDTDLCLSKVRELLPQFADLFDDRSGDIRLPPTVRCPRLGDEDPGVPSGAIQEALEPEEGTPRDPERIHRGLDAVLFHEEDPLVSLSCFIR